MDNLDNQLRDIFSKWKNEEVPEDFSDKVVEKIEVEKEKRIRRNENLFQSLFITLSAIVFCVCMFSLNRYYFHIEIDTMVIKTNSIFSDMKGMFQSNIIISWPIICINALILILLEQFLSKKLSKKFNR